MARKLVDSPFRQLLRPARAGSSLTTYMTVRPVRRASYASITFIGGGVCGSNQDCSVWYSNMLALRKTGERSVI